MRIAFFCIVADNIANINTFFLRFIQRADNFFDVLIADVQIAFDKNS